MVSVKSEDSYFVTSSERTTSTAIFGLLSPQDYHQAYLCDMGALGLLDGWEELEEDEFESRCIGYYNESTAKNP